MANQESAILDGPVPVSANARRINFNETDVKEYDGYFTMIIGDILTQKECADLVKLASPPDNVEWPPATVTAYNGSQILDTESRFCGRIFYTSKVLADSLLERVLLLLPPEIITIKDVPGITGQFPVIRKETWRICRLNNKLRFLKYGPGHYFKPHCDGQFTDQDGAQIFLTLYLYLNGGGGAEDKVEGGATRFAVDFEDPQAGKLDVDPKAGSLVIFFNRDMYHEGVTVTKGTRYTMRTDAMYENI